MLLRGRKKRGILLPVSALRSNHGIGDFGAEAYGFIDFLNRTNQDYWQILPLVPTDENGSPYKSVSAFAGEILYISLDLLVRDGLLLQSELKDASFPEYTDYAAARKYKLPLLKKAAARFDTDNLKYRLFLRLNSYWIEDYALFCAALERFNTKELYDLPEGIKYRQKDAVEEFEVLNKRLIDFYKITQFIFYSQYYALKRYAFKSGITVIGDIPFYVSANSADVWANPQYFCVGADIKPTKVAGVPPDIFSKEGQLWGNPIYDFKEQRRDGYLWWKQRFMHAKRLYGAIRIDHFRAFANYYVINAGESAEKGHFENGVFDEIFICAKKSLHGLKVIAEDLGGEDDKTVKSLLAKTGFPNMKVLQFAFNGDKNNCFLPRNFNRNCVCYTGTHDNDTAMGFFENAPAKQRITADFLMPYKGEMPFSHRMIRYAMESRADTVIIPIQDYLCEGGEYRINTPSTLKGNWKYRLKKDAVSETLAATVKRLSKR